jgi:hypothetical protein
MQSSEVGFKEIVRLISHTLLVFVFLLVWLITAWAMDKMLMAWFPLEGLSLVSFRLLEVLVHVSTFRLVSHMVFRWRGNNHVDRWWV